MGFGKPFRAAPIKLGAHYAEKERQRFIDFAAKVLAVAVALGLATGVLSAERGRMYLAILLGASTQPIMPARANDPPAGAYYPGCNAARAAGVAPLLRGEPGYRPEMDGDDDGIACEPHRSF